MKKKVTERSKLLIMVNEFYLPSMPRMMTVFSDPNAAIKQVLF